MGFGILAVICVLLLSPIGGRIYYSSVSFDLFSLLFLWMYVGIYCIYRRIHSKWILVALWLCAIFAIGVLVLPLNQATMLPNTFGPWLFLLVLQGSKKECSEKTQKQIHFFSIYFIVWYVVLWLYSRMVSPMDFFTTPLSKMWFVILVILQLIVGIWLTYLCLRMNHELKELAIRQLKERSIPHTQRNTILALLLLLICIVSLYLLQFPYRKQILEQRPVITLVSQDVKKGSIQNLDDEGYSLKIEKNKVKLFLEVIS